MSLTEQIITDPAEALGRFAELDEQGIEFTVVKTVTAYVGGEATDADGNVIAAPNSTTSSYAFRYDAEAGLRQPEVQQVNASDEGRAAEQARPASSRR